MNPKKTKRKKKASAKNKGLVSLSAMVPLSSFCLMGAVAATATMDVFVRIIRPVDIQINTSMDFGTLAITDEKAGKATINPLTDNLFIDARGSLALASGMPRAGRLEISGAGASPISVTIEQSQIALTNGTTSVIVDNFAFATRGGELTGSQVTVTPTGTRDRLFLSIGATLNTREGQLTGAYTGSNRIFAHYQ